MCALFPGMRILELLDHWDSITLPHSKGAPSFVRLYEYPRLDGPGAIVASKSFYRADNVKFLWNKKGIHCFSCIILYLISLWV